MASKKYEKVTYDRRPGRARAAHRNDELELAVKPVRTLGPKGTDRQAEKQCVDALLNKADPNSERRTKETVHKPMPQQSNSTVRCLGRVASERANARVNAQANVSVGPRTPWLTPHPTRSVLATGQRVCGATHDLNGLAPLFLSFCNPPQVFLRGVADEPACKHPTARPPHGQLHSKVRPDQKPRRRRLRAGLPSPPTVRQQGTCATDDRLLACKAASDGLTTGCNRKLIPDRHLAAPITFLETLTALTAGDPTLSLPTSCSRPR
jgi:hypothetical protein